MPAPSPVQLEAIPPQAKIDPARKPAAPSKEPNDAPPFEDVLKDARTKPAGKKSEPVDKPVDAEMPADPAPAKKAAKAKRAKSADEPKDAAQAPDATSPVAETAPSPDAIPAEATVAAHTVPEFPTDGVQPAHAQQLEQNAAIVPTRVAPELALPEATETVSDASPVQGQPIEAVVAAHQLQPVTAAQDQPDPMDGEQVGQVVTRVAQEAKPSSETESWKPTPVAAAESVIDAQGDAPEHHLGSDAQPDASADQQPKDAPVRDLAASQTFEAGARTTTFSEIVSSTDTVDAWSADATKPTAPTTTDRAPATPQPPPTPREFAQANHDKLVSAVRAQLLPKGGGAMQIRLDPPQLGALEVAVRMLDGVMNVSFQTSNDEATKLLSHSLGQLKHALESQGVSVDKIHVQQSVREQQPSSTNDNDPRHDRDGDGRGGADARHHEHQRKEMLRRMWRRLALGNDPLDLVA